MPQGIICENSKCRMLMFPPEKEKKLGNSRLNDIFLTGGSAGSVFKAPGNDFALFCQPVDSALSGLLVYAYDNAFGLQIRERL